MPFAGIPERGAFALPTPRARARRGATPFWRGLAGAVGLAAWTVVGVIGAALALVPVVLEGGPRGLARRPAAARPQPPTSAPPPAAARPVARAGGPG